jgi:hypothetical protein
VNEVVLGEKIEAGRCQATLRLCDFLEDAGQRQETMRKSRRVTTSAVSIAVWRNRKERDPTAIWGGNRLAGAGGRDKRTGTSGLTMRYRVGRRG